MCVHNEIIVFVFVGVFTATVFVLCLVRLHLTYIAAPTVAV